MSVNGGPNIFDTSLLIYLDAADRDSYTPGSTTWYDLSGNNNNFTLYNGVGFNSKNKGYLTFDGTNDYVRSTNTIDLTVYGGVVVEITLFTNNTGSSIWWEFSSNWNSNPGGMGLSGNENGGGNVVGQCHSQWNGGTDGRNYNMDNPSTQWQTHTNIFMRQNDPTGRLTYVSSNLKNYVTGPGYSTSTSTTTSMVFRNDNFYLGSRGGTVAFLNGNISSFKVYTIKLSQSEILQNYNNTKSRFGL
jgi:hypothetical protein